jgi:DNA-binding NtrC family response regulator
MSLFEKKILIVDEVAFSRVCSAILELEGYRAATITSVDNLEARLDGEEFGLIITSYPYGAFFFKEIGKRRIPIIILSDHINRDLVDVLEGFNHYYCMIKPLDYLKFRSLVKQVMDGEQAMNGGYNIV